jgi:hypothetical protein
MDSPLVYMETGPTPYTGASDSWGGQAAKASINDLAADTSTDAIGQVYGLVLGLPRGLVLVAFWLCGVALMSTSAVLVCSIGWALLQGV